MMWNRLHTDTSKWTWAKITAIALVAILLPAILLSFIQYRSLTEIQKKTQASVRENLRQTLQTFSTRVRGKLEDYAAGITAAIPADELKQKNLDPLDKRLLAIKQTHKEVENLFVQVYRPSQTNAFSIVRASNGAGFWTGGHYASNSLTICVNRYFNEGFATQKALNPKIRSFVGEAECLEDTVKKLPSVAVITPLFEGEELKTFYACPPCTCSQHDKPFDKPGRCPECEMTLVETKEFGFAALTLDFNYLTEIIFPEVVAEMMNGSDDPEKEAERVNGSDDMGKAYELAFMLFDENRKLLYTSREDVKNHEVAIPFSPIVEKYKLVISYKNITLEALAENNFKQNLIFNGLVFALLIGGIFLTLRAITREIKLTQAKSAFVANVSHELKTPLSLIRLFAETLELGRLKSPEKAQEYYRIINNESRRLTQLINNILDFSKIEAGRREYQFAETNLAEVIQEVLRSYEYQIIGAGFQLQTEIDNNLPAVSLDRDAIAQALLNLLNNAVKYSPTTKHLEVRAFALSNRVIIEIADRGIGIPRSEQKKIFEKFYRVSNGLVHDTKGSGLGLSIVKHIIEAHGGQISVESITGKGSRFIVAIPVKANGTTAVSVNERANQQANGRELSAMSENYDNAQDINR
jgi:signal transduction histidine kinase